MTKARPWLGILCCTLAGCLLTPPGPPEEVAPKIVAALDADRPDEADQLFEASAAEEGGSELLYPLLYEEARGRYQKGESTSSVRLLRFMAGHYPDALGVREALVYALFLERAQGNTSPELVKEVGTVVTELKKSGGTTPHWIHLVEAQLAIDRGEPDAAREVFAGFKKSWDGQPEELAVYVEDIDRYLSSRP